MDKLAHNELIAFSSKHVPHIAAVLGAGGRHKRLLRSDAVYQSEGKATPTLTFRVYQYVQGNIL
jgi:hypothetical protein